MLKKLQSVLGKDGNSAGPSARSVPLLSSKPKEEQISMSFAEVETWLSTQEEMCKEKRANALIRSREVVSKLIPAMRVLIKTIDDTPTEEVLHPKVVQVNAKQLPLFKSKMLSVLDVTFADDDEEFYAHMTIILNSAFKVFRGSGRYLHQSYPVGIRSIRDHLDLFGKEINVMTAAIRESREHMIKINEARKGYEQYADIEAQYNDSGVIKNAMRARITECKKEILKIQNDAKKYRETEEYHIYQYHKTEREQQKAMLDEAQNTLQLRLNTSLQVWKRAMHAFNNESNKKNAVILAALIALVEKNGVASDPDKVMSELKKVVHALFSSIQKGTVTLKNEAERTYFTSAEDYVSGLSSAFGKFHSKRSLYESATTNLAKQRSPAVFLKMQEKLKQLEREIHDLEGKISKPVRKQGGEDDIRRARFNLQEKLNECANYNSQVPVTIIVTDLEGTES